MGKTERQLNDLKNVSLGLLAEGKTIRIRAHGYSMYPAIKPGTVILIEPVRKKGPPAPGEIVAIKRKNGIIVHRIVKVINEEGKRKYVARGDSNAYPDPPVDEEMIVGRVTGVEGLAFMPEDFKKKPAYFINRLRVIGIHLRNKLRG